MTFRLTVIGVLSTAVLLGAIVSAESPKKPTSRPKAAPVSQRPFDAKEAAGKQDQAARDIGVQKDISLDLGNNVSMKLILIPNGKFMMGPTADIKNGKIIHEAQQHEVTISKPFYMAIYEVTQEQYERVTGKNPSSCKGGQNPVEQVCWDDAVECCKKLSGRAGKTVRLPTEAEWEYACRAGTNTRFYCGDGDAALGDYGWYSKNSEGKTHPVGQKKANAWGLYDMNGNVSEWCSDWYSDLYANEKTTDPQGPESGSARVLRGTSFRANPWSCDSASRWKEPPFKQITNAGFRVAMDVK